MRNFIDNHPNLWRVAAGASVVAASLGPVACGSESSAAMCPTSTEQNITSVNKYYESSERDACINLVVQDASEKILKAYEANPDNYTVSKGFISASLGVTDDKKGNFVNIDPKQRADHDPKTPTLSMYAFLGSDGKFDLSKGTILSVAAGNRVVTIEPPTKFIPFGSDERYVNQVNETGIPTHDWSMYARFPNDQAAEHRYMQDTNNSLDPEVHRRFEQGALTQVAQALKAL